MHISDADEEVGGVRIFGGSGKRGPFPSNAHLTPADGETRGGAGAEGPLSDGIRHLRLAFSDTAAAGCMKLYSTRKRSGCSGRVM